ncbi:hypothetical protein BB559_007213, partial [Furculomyces boomerangus]
MKDNSSVVDIEKETLVLNQAEHLTENEIAIHKRYLRKVDLRILPIVVLVAISCFIDRGIIAAALVYGLVPGMKLNATQQGNVTTFFFVFYIIFEAPANIMLKRVKPHYWFGFLALGFSITTLMQAFAKNGNTLTILRSLLGVFEAGISPGIVGYLNYWYTRSEVSLRMVLFFFSVPLAGVIGSPFAAAVSHIKIKSIKPYQNVFLFTGILTLVVGILALFLIHDYPDTAKFLDPEEKELILRRLNREQGLASKTKGSISEALKFLMDWKLWVFCLIYFGNNNAVNVLSLFIPTVAATLGYNPTQSTMIYMGYYIVGLVGMLVYIFLLRKKPFWVVISFFSAFTAITYY